MYYRMLLWLVPMVLLFSTHISAQNAISFSAHQDLRLLTIGDNRGNNTGTLDILTRLKYSGKERENGYYFYYLEYENASIKNNYNRLGVGFGYALTHTLNNKKIELSPTIGIGNIHRKNINSLSLSGSVSLALILNKRLKLSSMLQFVDRSDLKIKVLRFSFFVGLEIRLFSLKS